MKTHILYPFKNGPWGGANQFLHALKKRLCVQGVFSDIPEDSDILLFNLNPSALLDLLPKVLKIKQRFPEKILLVRIDGPVFLVRNKDLEIDHAFFYFTKNFADGIVFQSNWSKQSCFKLGLNEIEFQTTILNAPDPDIFNTKNKRPFSNNRKVRIIATSWSANWKKGFDVYTWLDEHIDFSRYEITFVGNSPVIFKNIRQISPMDSKTLAMELKKNDIFITASQNDPCSNSLIEAMHCGIPAIALNDGGHPEIVGQGGELFNHPEEIPFLLEKIIDNYTHYQSAVNLPTIEDISIKYQKFMDHVYGEAHSGRYTPKHFNFLFYLKLRWSLERWKMTTRWNRIKSIRIGFKQ